MTNAYVLTDIISYMSEMDRLPDHYAALQVHPRAEPEIIEAAYRRLMRKYHPDVIAPELRDDPELLIRIRAINVAYDVLSDPSQRSAYDALISRTVAEIPQSLDSIVETHILLVRCSKSRESFRMLIGRKAETKNLFRVLGFEPIKLPAQITASATQSKILPALPEPAKSLRGIQQLLNWLKPPKDRVLSLPDQPASFPSTAEIHAMFDSETTLNFTDIDFGAWKCPSCDGMHTDTDGTSSTWCRCEACMQISCAGGIHSKKIGEVTRCPWCRRRARINRRIRPGDKVDMPVKGEIRRSARGKRIPPEISSGGDHNLPEGHKEA